MLEESSQIAIAEVVFRIANPPRFRVALADLNASLEDAIETIDFLGAANEQDAGLMLTVPFQDDPTGNFKPSPTRYSDATWRVFYSALEPETAAAEKSYWCRREMAPSPSAIQRFQYRELRCRLNTSGYDLRALVGPWPFLTGDETAYPTCQALAKEAIGEGAGALLCPSARRPEGTTAPVFVQTALSEPAILGVVIIEILADGSSRIVRPS